MEYGKNVCNTYTTQQQQRRKNRVAGLNPDKQDKILYVKKHTLTAYVFFSTVSKPAKPETYE